ncbi:hypothetical protein ACFUKV_15320 [Streptomyces paradoxus]|uniref:hypothetical protein n=1 Tax=Streptomyces paradoxus TaxID=66375 RepID=UPI003643E7B1
MPRSMSFGTFALAAHGFQPSGRSAALAVEEGGRSLSRIRVTVVLTIAASATAAAAETSSSPCLRRRVRSAPGVGAPAGSRGGVRGRSG